MAMSAYYLKGVIPPQVQLTDIFGDDTFYVVTAHSYDLVIFPQIGLWLLVFLSIILICFEKSFN